MAKDEEPVTNQTSLVEVLGTLNKGKDLVVVDESMASLVDAVKQHGGKGWIMVKVTLQHIESLDNGVAQLAVSLECKVTEPKVRVVPTTFFANEKNFLSREDPNQLKLPLGENVRTIRKEAN